MAGVGIIRQYNLARIPRQLMMELALAHPKE
ncbi:uncharacterized protein G2W53_036640 [Senna tora]|uniref:Uncharacterized protein n=1 Tax=Senna tora TaxID=362788 RepID=A0A834SXT3_9FABA|nr:uncharacterized protein G2W53_036640 [Senna tora]